MRFQFPHFPRFFSARLFFGLESILLWFGLAALVGVNVMEVQKGRPVYWNKLMMVLEHPFSLDWYVDLAGDLWQQGHKLEARQLMRSAQELTQANQTTSKQTTNVLGATTSPEQLLAQWEDEVYKTEKRYVFWQGVATQRPDYRDAYVTVASLAYQLGKLDEARSWLTKAQAIDPNSTTMQKLSTLLE